ncbi:MAG TPA: hypothetical protein VNZ52_08805, partial [Candidatus Thermoplasmatota archaeon]|nr:hypothetical protein [Candidatus Thermoplasmatota archaeon]
MPNRSLRLVALALVGLVLIPATVEAQAPSPADVNRVVHQAVRTADDPRPVVDSMDPFGFRREVERSGFIPFIPGHWFPRLPTVAAPSDPTAGLQVPRSPVWTPGARDVPAVRPSVPAVPGTEGVSIEAVSRLFDDTVALSSDLARNPSVLAPGASPDQVVTMTVNAYAGVLTRVFNPVLSVGEARAAEGFRIQAWIKSYAEAFKE